MNSDLMSPASEWFTCSQHMQLYQLQLFSADKSTSHNNAVKHKTEKQQEALSMYLPTKSPHISNQ